MVPIGILGGTFNPIHFGHLRMAQELGEGLGLSGVRLVPAGIPPHRDQPDVAPSHRLEMVRLAMEGNPLLHLDAREISKPTPCYTVETLAELRHELGAQQPLCLLLGADAFFGLTTWHRWRELFDLAHLVIAQRPGAESLTRALPALPGELAAQLNRRLRHEAAALTDAPAGAIVVHPITALDISATRIRELLRTGQSPRYLLPAAVLAYIQTHHLYL